MNNVQSICECDNVYTHTWLLTLSCPKHLQSLLVLHGTRQTFELELFSCLTVLTWTFCGMLSEQMLMLFSNYPFVFIKPSSAGKLMFAAPAQKSIAMLCWAFIREHPLLTQEPICKSANLSWWVNVLFRCFIHELSHSQAPVGAVLFENSSEFFVNRNVNALHKGDSTAFKLLTTNWEMGELSKTWLGYE